MISETIAHLVFMIALDLCLYKVAASGFKLERSVDQHHYFSMRLKANGLQPSEGLWQLIARKIASARCAIPKMLLHIML